MSPRGAFLTDVRQCLGCGGVVATVGDDTRGCDCEPTCVHPHLPSVVDISSGRTILRILDAQKKP